MCETSRFNTVWSPWNIRRLVAEFDIREAHNQVLGEPLYILAHNLLLIRVRVRVEMAALALKVCPTQLLKIKERYRSLLSREKTNEEKKYMKAKARV